MTLEEMKTRISELEAAHTEYHELSYKVAVIEREATSKANYERMQRTYELNQKLKELELLAETPINIHKCRCWKCENE